MITRSTLACILAVAFLNISAKADEEFSGIYAGAGFGYDRVKAELFVPDLVPSGPLEDSIDGLNVLADLGYRHQASNGLVLGLEAAFEYSFAKQFVPDLDVNLKKRRSFGANVTIGYQVVENLLASVQAGYVHSRFSLNEGMSSVLIASDSIDGFSVGPRFEYLFNPQFGIRAGYRYIFYEDFDAEKAGVEDILDFTLNIDGWQANAGFFVQF